MRFSVLVLTSNGCQEEAEMLLSQFDENLEVPAYKKPCWCVGTLAKARAHKIAEEHMPIEAARRAFLQRDDVRHMVKSSKEAGNYGFSQAVDVLWQNEFEIPFEIRCDEILKDDPSTADPNPNCTDCQGKGIEVTTYNPNAKWDDYSFDGGIWSTEFANLQGKTAEEFLQQPVRTFAIVTPAGLWLEKGQLVYFSVISQHPNWEELYEQTLKTFAQSKVLIYDCHI